MLRHRCSAAELNCCFPLPQHFLFVLFVVVLNDESSASVVLRTSPQDSDCHSSEWPGQCPNVLTFTRNVFVQGSNTSTVLFEGDFRPDNITGHLYTFAGNAYSSDVNSLDAGFPAFGGVSARMCGGCDPTNTSQTDKQTWQQWQASGQDVAGVVVPKGVPIFADAAWATSFNLTLDPAGPVAANARNGFTPFDASAAGLLVAADQ